MSKTDTAPEEAWKTPSAQTTSSGAHTDFALKATRKAFKALAAR